MLAQLEQGLVGASAGESREIGVDFPADYRATELAGKHAVFKVDVKSVEEPSLPALDEEFCTAFGVTEGGVAKLREDVAREHAPRARSEPAQPQQDGGDGEALSGESRRRAERACSSRRSGTCRSRSCAAPAPRTSRRPRRASRLIEPARRRVALGLLINDIIRREKIVLDPARSNARLDEMVGAYGDAAALKRAYLQNADAMRQVESLALEDQVVDWILAHAKVHERPSTFKELMNFEG